MADARRAGLDRWHLQGKTWRRIGPAVYVPASIAASTRLALAAALLRLPANCVFCRLTAAWLHRLDVPPCDPIEVIVPKASGVTTRAGLAISRARLADSEVVHRDGLPATSMLRTLIDIGLRLELTEAIVIVDMALHRRRTTLTELHAAIDACTGGRNVRRLRRIPQLAEPKAESPMETRLRLILMSGGLPRPEAQVNLYDRNGDFIARTDLYYRSHRLAIEYDGVNHRDRLADDNRRQNAILSAGYGILRFTDVDVRTTPELTVARVRAAISSPRLAPRPAPT